MTQPTKTTQTNLNQFNRFLNNNTQFIYQKHTQYYPNKNIRLSDLSTQAILQSTLSFIYDIFSFHKYQNDTKLNKTLKSSLVVNIKSFVKQAEDKKVLFNKEISVQLLKYCIENNDMFAVHYDKKNKDRKDDEEDKQKVEENGEKKEDVEDKKQETSQDIKKQNQEQNNKENILNGQNQQKKQQIQKNQQIINDDHKMYNQEPVKQIKQQPNFLMQQNQFDCIQSQQKKQKSLNLQLVRRQLKDVFQFYNKQLQNIGPTFTFDSISQKSHTMTIGKFLTFCNAANILYNKDKAYSQGKIQKKTIIGLYKKKAEGRSNIDFKMFLEILDQIYIIDKDIYTRMGLGQEGRKGKLKVIEKYKYINLPFSTRDPQGRQKHIHGIKFIPKLTSHSGKHEQQLRIDLNTRKQRPLLYNNIMKSSQSKYSISRTKILSNRINDKQIHTSFVQKTDPKPQNQHDYRFLSKLISAEDNDDIFLKEYGIDKIDNRYINQRQDQDNRVSKNTSKLILPLIKQPRKDSMQRKTQLPPNRRYSNYQ